MIEPCRLPIGLRQLREEYHHFTYLGYDVRVTLSPNTWEYNHYYNGELSFEMWTEPNIFHGHILVNLIDKSIIAIIREEEHGRYSLPELEFKNPDMYKLVNKVMDLYILLSKKQYDIFVNKKSSEC